VLLRRQQPESLDATARALREGARRKVGALESRWRKKRVVLERAREEFVRNLQYLKALQEEGRYPVSQLAPAILREELRLQHLESELKKLDEAFRLAKDPVSQGKGVPIRPAQGGQDGGQKRPGSGSGPAFPGGEG
jgi:hypothetical protein